MKVTIEIKTGAYPGRNPNPKDIQSQIDALEKVVIGQPLTGHEQLLVVGVKSILRAIKGEIDG